MALKYTEKTMDHFTNPKNLGVLENFNAEATEGSPACGDMVHYTLKINDETLIVEDIKFKSYGCASNIATASIATEMVKGKHIDEIMKMGSNDAAKELGGLPTVKMHCSVLAINGIKEAIRKYKEEKGLSKQKAFVLSEEAVKKILKHIINPKQGVNLIDNNNVASISIEEDNSVFIVIKLEADEEMYGNNIHEEIMEHLEKIEAIRGITVKIESKTGKFM